MTAEATEKLSPLAHAHLYFDHHALNQIDQITSDYNLRMRRNDEALTHLSEIYALDASIANSITYLQQLPGVVPQLIEELVLMSAEDDLCTDADAFAAAVLVFSDGDPQRIEPVINEFCTKSYCREGLAVALAWLPLETTLPWLKAFLQSKDLNHKWLACRACSLMCKYPRDVIHSLAARDDCTAHGDLLQTIIYLAGQVRDKKLLPLCQEISQQQDHPLQAQALWSRMLLEENNQSLRDTLIDCALQNNDNFALLGHWLARACPWQEAKTFLGQASRNTELARDLILKSLAYYGDPGIIAWLLNHTENPGLLRCAGLTFMQITGLDIAPYGLKPEPEVDTSVLYLDEDFSLLIPNRQQLITLWRHAHQGFNPQQRYFLGQPQNNNRPNPANVFAPLGFVRHYCAMADTLFHKKPYRHFETPRRA